MINMCDCCLASNMCEDVVGSCEKAIGYANAIYNKALDDFIRALDQHCGYYQGENKILTRNDVLKIAENIKNYKKI